MPPTLGPLPGDPAWVADRPPARWASMPCSEEREARQREMTRPRPRPPNTRIRKAAKHTATLGTGHLSQFATV